MDFIGRGSEILGISREVTSTIFVSIGVFVLGLLINGLIKTIGGYIERRRTRQLAKINHRLLISQIRKEIMNLKFFGDSLDIDFEGTVAYRYASLPYLSVFFEIGYQNLYRAYFSGFENLSLFSAKKRLKALADLWNMISFLEKHHDDIRNRGEKGFDRGNEFNEARNTVVAKANHIIDNFRLNYHGKLNSQEPLGIFFNEREGIVKAFADIPNRFLPKIANNYLLNILDHMWTNIDLCAQYPEDIKYVELASIIREAEHRFKSQENHLFSLHLYFIGMHEEYYKLNKRLISSYRILNR